MGQNSSLYAMTFYLKMKIFKNEQKFYLFNKFQKLNGKLKKIK